MSDLPLPTLLAEERSPKLELDGCRAALVDDRTVFVILKDGTVYPLEFVADGKIVSRLSFAPALAQTTVPTVIKPVGADCLFVGSTVGPSILLKTARVEKEVSDDRPSAVVDMYSDVLLDDDDGQYFPFSSTLS